MFECDARHVESGVFESAKCRIQNELPAKCSAAASRLSPSPTVHSVFTFNTFATFALSIRTLHTDLTVNSSKYSQPHGFTIPIKLLLLTSRQFHISRQQLKLGKITEKSNTNMNNEPLSHNVGDML